MIEPTPRVLCHNLPCEDLFHTCHPLRYCLLFLWLSLPFPPDQPHTMTIERRTEALTYVWELLDESLRLCPIARLHLLLQFNWLARYHPTPNFIFPMRLRSLSLDFIGAMKCSACPTGHGIITETVLNYLLDDKDYLMSVIKEISIKLCSEQSRTCVQKLRELITSHSSKIKLFSWFNTDHLPPRFRSVIMDLAHCPLKILEIPLSEVTIHLFLNGSEGSLCSSLRRLSLHADGKWFGILPPEEKLEVCEWVCQRRLEQLSLCNIVLPRYPNVSVIDDGCNFTDHSRIALEVDYHDPDSSNTQGRFVDIFRNSNHEREQWLSDVHRAFDTFFRNGRKGNRSDTIRSIHV